MTSASRPNCVQRDVQQADVPDRLRHLLLAHLHHPVVHPQAGQRLAARRPGLRRLVLVMGKDEVRAAPVDVEVDARGSAPPSPSTRCASPGGPAPTARATQVSSPSLCRLPQREVERILLAVDALDPLPLVHLLDVAVRELAIVGVRAHAEVHVAAGDVGVAAVDERLDEIDDRSDRLRGQRLVVGPAEPEASVSASRRRSSPAPAARWARPARGRRRRSCR